MGVLCPEHKIQGKTLIHKIVSKILITGASGLIGKRLTEMLRAEGHEVFHLGRTKQAFEARAYLWDVKKKYIEQGALDGKDIIIHLAGAPVADKRWSKAHKQDILESRTQSTRLLFEELKKRKHQVHSVICASAIGYYGFENNSHEYVETDEPGKDFLAHVVQRWEVEQEHFRQLNVRLVNIRIGIVLSKEGGALEQMIKPVKYYLGAPLGTGKQNMSWIHINDICGMFVKAVQDKSMEGPYNGVAPAPATNREVTKAIGRALRKPVFLPAVPGFLLKAVLGEMADLVLQGSNVSARKILNAGYKFQFPTLDGAVSDLIGRR